MVCDRFIDSSIVYQGIARGLGVDAIRDASLFATSGVLPVRTIVLHGVERRDAVPDRIEAAGDDFHESVLRGFLTLEELDPKRVRLVEAQGSVEAVAERVWAALEDLCP